MDVRNLKFEPESFDKVLCIHVMDFVNDKRQATGEILRVLKNGGQFVITYPSNREGPGLGRNLLKDSMSNDPSKHKIMRILKLIARVAVITVYIPLLFRKQTPYSKSQLKSMLTGLTIRNFQVEEDFLYQDFIVFGTK